MEWAQLFNEARVVGFLLLFVRFGALFMTAPIFSHESIPMNVKAAMAFFFTIVFYPAMPPVTIELNLAWVMVAMLSEILFGLAIGLILLLAYHVISFAGGIISFMMGFSMASAIDPQTGVSMPIISQFLSLIGLMVLFSLDLHHWLLYYMNDSIAAIPLGGFLMEPKLFDYTMQATANMFKVGFMIAFPIIALTWLQDIIFGMLMKSMPQFNLLVIGFPIKIGVGFIVLIATLSSVMLILQMQVQGAFNWMEALF
jgi:flagellar biosynthetic protein FliR